MEGLCNQRLLQVFYMDEYNHAKYPGAAKCVAY